MRELKTVVYNSDEHTDENSIAKLRLSRADVDSKLTYLWGNDQFDKQFTFISMTEGQGAIEEINSFDYTWPVMDILRRDVTVQSYTAPANVTKPGEAQSTIKVYFEDNWGHKDYGMLAPDGETQVRIMREPESVGTKKWLYELQVKGGSASDHVALELLEAGAVWVLTAPTVSQSGSTGNASNRQGPGEMTNQISLKRYTMSIEGNVANKVVPIEFKTSSGGTTTRWMAEEQRQFDVNVRAMNNFDFYVSKYNKNSKGEVTMKDKTTGKPVPEGAGIREQIIESGNYDTYGYTLTLAKINNTITSVFWGKPDGGNMEIVVYCGMGFMQDFDNAIKSDVQGNHYYEATGDKVVNGTGNALSYGAYFKQYRHISGHVLTLKHDQMFDIGELAILDQKNGNLHPRTNYPMSSHTGVFLDHSNYEGNRNVVMKVEKGRSSIYKVIPGMSPLPAEWGVVEQKTGSTDKDEASYEAMFSRGICIKNNKHCFLLQSKQ